MVLGVVLDRLSASSQVMLAILVGALGSATAFSLMTAMREIVEQTLSNRSKSLRVGMHCIGRYLSPGFVNDPIIVRYKNFRIVV